MRGEMTVVQYVVRQMQAWGIDVVFGVPGDTLLPLLEELRREGRPRFVVCRHEGAAALMASAYGKMSGRLAACVADSGPGAVQMLNGIYDAAMDRVPLLAITGELPTRRAGTGWPQDADTDGLYREATAFSRTLADGGQACRIFSQALRRATLESSPVRVGVPKNLWMETIPDVRVEEPFQDFGGRVEIDPERIGQAARWLEEANRPVLFAGLGVRHAVGALLELAERLQAPIVHTMPAIGLVPAENPWNVGVIGPFGTQAAADVLGRADLVLVVGTTWWHPEYAAPHARIIQIDRRLEHIGLACPVDLGIWGDAADVLPRLAAALGRTYRPEWAAAADQARRSWDGEIAQVASDMSGPLHPAAVAAAVGRALVPGAAVSLDVGNNAFWFSRYFRGPEIRLLLSGHWRTVGFGLPGAIGAKLAAPSRQVVAFTGDGGFAMSMAELATAVQHRLAIACVVLRDGRYAEEEFLQRQTGRRPFGTALHNPDWAAYARACGAAGYRVENGEQLARAVQEALPRLAEGQVAVLDVATAPATPRRAEPRRGTRPAGETVRAWGAVEAGVTGR
ncbi:MAG: thiamine pyrophosphate-binding protein [Firmicutes bacterium]|nr:thiamine pyrophosphate-binding protein [Bacillota bacterium]